MNTERTSSSARRSPARALRPFRVFFVWLAAALVLVGLAATASQAGMKTTPKSGVGSVLALAAQLRSARLHAAAASAHTPDGRTLLPRRMMRPGALVSRVASATSSVVPISGGVQTYDVSNPPPAFRPLVGYGSLAALNNSSTNPPVYVSTLTPTNLTPVWSADETFIVFSSNRNQTGGVNADATDGSGGSRFHLWAISVNGGEAFQITTSTGPENGGELFPALSRNNLTVAFTSDAATPGTQNLYALAFSYSTLSAGAAPTDLLPTQAVPVPPAPLTLRASTEAASSARTGFDRVLRPTFSPNDDQLIVFAARSVVPANYADQFAGHDHLYFLYTSSGGFSQGNNVSYPGKLTDGPADDTDPTFAPDGSYIAFASTASAAGFTRNPNNAFGPATPSDPQDPNDSQSLSGAAVATRSVFLISGGLSSTGVPFGTVPTILGTGGRISLGSTGGFDDYGPAWSSFANQNQYTNPSGNFAYLAFGRSTVSTTHPHNIVFFQAASGVSAPSTETLKLETAGAANAAVKLNTDDNAGETSVAGNIYDDIYPTWSPFLSIFSIAYMSNRTVTYNNPASGNPVEVAASVGPGGSVTNTADTTQNYSVGSGYEGLLVSQVLNLDPPTLLRFSANEVVHVQAAGTLNASGSSADPVNGTANKLAVTGGQKVTLTVRLSSREAGIANTSGPNGGPRVYVQIKDPDSKYQDALNAEHKVFVKDAQYIGQANQPLSDSTSGTAYTNLGSTGFGGFENYGDYGNIDFRRYEYPSYGPTVGSVQVGYVFPRGAHGGSYPAGANNPSGPPGTYIFVGRDTGGTNPYPVSYGAASALTVIPYGNPDQFIPWGPEFECQVVNPQFAAAGATDTRPDDPTVTVANPAGASGGVIGDYVTPYYLAGVDDQGAFSGGATAATGTDRPVADYTTTNTTAGGGTQTVTHPAEWLQLTKVPTAADGTQDGDANGGVLYTVTWTAPATGSDFYVDVIAYDNAVFPKIPGIAQYTGAKTNWRIYDNVGGFSTNSSIGGNDILLVSDYALGQKFAATTFGGRNLNLNLVPKQFGTESYLSDVDVSILPNSVYAGIPTTPTSYQFNPALRSFVSNFFANPDDTTTNIEIQNGLGVGSYYDSTIDDTTRVTVGGGKVVPNVQSQRYSIWRILSRGPVPASLLQSYTPTPVLQPAIADAADPAYAHLPAASVLDAPRCVIWLSPYTGDVLADPGTLDDPGNVGTAGTTQPRSSTTSILSDFVKNGGRLFLTGQDVGSTLTQGGTVNNTPSAIAGSPNFLPDVLNATLASTSAGTNVLAATNNRITGPPSYDGINQGRSLTNISTFAKPGDIIEVEFPNFAYQDNLVLGDADYNDGSYSQIPAQTLPGGASVQGQIDTIAPINGAVTAMTYGASGPAALVYHNDPYIIGPTGTGTSDTLTLPNGGTGSRVVYAAFGLEGLSDDYDTIQDPDPSSDITNGIAFDQRIPPVAPRNPRPMIIHNIVSFLRTGYVSGTITQTAGTGQGGGLGIDGVTVYLRPTAGPPPTRAAFSALTANGGRFTIAGVEAGTYTLVAVKPGFQRAVSNSNVSFTVEGDTTATGATLTLTPQQPGNIAGAVHDAANNLISGATVTFTSQDGSVTRTAVSANGSVTGSTTENYFLQNVPVTNYTATVTSPLNPAGQAEYAAPAPNVPDTPYNTGVAVQPNTTVQPVNFTLTPILGTISGTVTNSATSALLPGATVTLYDSTNTTAVAGVTAAVTAANGTYTLTGIPATTAATSYYIRVTAPGFAPGGAASGPVYLGSIITEAAIPIAPIVSGTLNGVVTDQSTGQPLAGATVTFTPTTGTVLTATTGADGAYSLALVPTGTYTATASGPTTGTAYQPSAGQTVTVSGTGTVTTNFALVPILGTVSGTAKDASTHLPLAGVTITVTDASNNAVATTPTPITTDASGAYSATLTPGTYFVTASKASYVSQTSPATAFALGATVPVSFSLVSSIGTVGGLVTDQNGTTLVAGASVTFVVSGQTTGITFTTTGASSAAPDGSGPINYTGQLATGTYTATVTKGGRVSAAKTVTVSGGVFNRADFKDASGLPALHTFPAGIQFVSTPYDYSSIGFDGLFGTKNTAATGTTANGNRSSVAVWNPVVGAYALDPTAPADALRLGVGYWVSLQNPMPVTQQGSTPTGSYVAVTLGQGWNQIGVPSATAIPVENLKFADGHGGMISYQQASTSQYNLIKYPLYGYSGGASYQTVDSTQSLQPWNAYWLYVSAPATLEIPTQ